MNLSAKVWVDEQVGKKFRNPEGEVYLCESYDPKIGFWMQQIDPPHRRTNISDRAIGRTFHETAE